MPTEEKKAAEVQTIHLGLSPKASGLIQQALVVASEGPYADNLDDDEVAILEQVIAEIDRQKGKNHG